MILSYIERYGQDGLVLSGLLAYVLVLLKSTTRTSTTSEESLGEGTSNNVLARPIGKDITTGMMTRADRRSGLL